MAVWTVHAPPSPGLSDEPVDDVVFIREGFSVAAFVFAPLWALAHRLWVTFALWLAAVIVISLIGTVFGDAITWPLTIGFLVWFGYEARDFQRARLTRRDWRLVDVVNAETFKLAERRYFEKVAETRATGAASSGTLPALMPPRPPRGSYPPVIGFTSGVRL
jgi:hypothetical protein